jgi:hypothetical protein
MRRGMRISGLVVALLIAAAAAPGGAGGLAPAQADAASCRPKGSRLVRLTTQVRLYEMTRPSIGQVVLYGCFRASGRKTQLGSTTTDFGQSHIQSRTPPVLRGRLAAIGTTDCINELFFSRFPYRTTDCRTFVSVVDLRSGKTLHFHWASWSPPQQNYLTDVKKIVLHSSGAVAWSTVSTRLERGEVVERDREVATLASTGAGSEGYQLLDRGDDLNTDSLALSGRTLRWSLGPPEVTLEKTYTLR